MTLPAPNRRMPSFTVVSPAYELPEPERVKRPGPVLVKPPGPDGVPLILKEPFVTTAIVELVPKVTGPVQMFVSARKFWIPRLPVVFNVSASLVTVILPLIARDVTPLNVE